jgi:uncharacterized protein with HEPN domain
MSGGRDDSLPLDDVIDAVERLMELAARVGDARLGQDRDTNEKMLWNIVVLGEAVRRMRPSTRDRFVDVPWKPIADARDWVIDHYDGVDWEVVAPIVSQELPPLLPRLREIRDVVRAEFDAGDA